MYEKLILSIVLLNKDRMRAGLTRREEGYSYPADLNADYSTLTFIMSSESSMWFWSKSWLVYHSESGTCRPHHRPLTSAANTTEHRRVR